VNLYEIAARFGWAALTRFAALLVLFLTLQLLRQPFALVLWLLDAGMRAINHATSTRLAAPIPPAHPKWRTA
jgi:hypothetical protein